MNNIPYITCGYPNLEDTKTYILNNQDKQKIILSIPFSDPVTEEPQLQEACIKALENGTTTNIIFALLKEIKEKNNVPLILKTYANVIFSYGSERFISKCKELNIQGLIIPDIPYEEREEFLPYCKKYNVHLIPMVSTQSQQRIEKIVKDAKSFIYITAKQNEDLSKTISEIKKYTDLPYISDQDYLYIL